MICLGTSSTGSHSITAISAIVSHLVSSYLSRPCRLTLGGRACKLAPQHPNNHPQHLHHNPHKFPPLLPPPQNHLAPVKSMATPPLPLLSNLPPPLTSSNSAPSAPRTTTAPWKHTYASPPHPLPTPSYPSAPAHTSGCPAPQYPNHKSTTSTPHPTPKCSTSSKHKTHAYTATTAS